MLKTALCLVLFFCSFQNLYAVEISEIQFNNYKIKRGDTLIKISGDAKKAPYLEKLNAIVPENLIIGNEIKIPASEEEWEKLYQIELMPSLREDLTNFPKIAVINLDKQLLGTYEFGKIQQIMPISSGSPSLKGKDYSTAKGEYKVLQKDKDHRSNKYLDKNGIGLPMFFGVRFDGPYWIHQGFLPGKKASHGCVRLSNKDAKYFYSWSKINTPIFIE